MKRLFKDHPMLVLVTALADLFGSCLYCIWANWIGTPASPMDMYVIVGMAIDIITIFLVGKAHKEWFFKDENGEDQ